jgi:hypothetical protein
MQPRKIDAGGNPAIRVTPTTSMMGQKFDQWLPADDPQHGAPGTGLATAGLKCGSAAAAQGLGKPPGTKLL